MVLKIKKRRMSLIALVLISSASGGAMGCVMIVLRLSINMLYVINITLLICLLFFIIFYKTPEKIFIRLIVDKINYYKPKFLKMTKHNGKLLDVGCGNDSPYSIKIKYPDVEYTGIDVGDYHQTKPNLADNYIVVKPEDFAEAIANIPELFDTVISSHNLEHCNDREKTLLAMVKVLKQGGYLYLSFPTEESVNFPGWRNGCLNYYDDPTHKEKPPHYEKTISILQANNMQIIFTCKSYKPILLSIIGFLNESKSKKDKETKLGTWAFWGFETIIWARKK